MQLTEQAARALRSHAERGWPEEVCGFLVGTVDRVEEARPATNGWGERSGETRRNRFAIAPDEYLEADKAARVQGFGIVGFYHSHPDAPAVPSRYDLSFAQETFPGYLHVIVSVAGGQVRDVRGWVLQDDSAAFAEVPLIEGEFE